VESKKVLAVLLRMSWIMAITVLIGVGVGILLTRWLPHEYTAKTRLFVSTTGGTSSTESYQGDQFSQQRAASYAQIVTSEQVAQHVVDQLGLQMSAGELASKVRAAAVPRTVLLDVAVKDKSPQRAADIANTLAAQFIAVAGTLETPVGQTEPRTTITIVNDADPPSSPSFPKLWTEVLYGGLGGLAVGLVAVGLLSALSKRIRSTDELAQITGIPALGPVDARDRDGEARSAQLIDWRTPEAEGFRRLRVQIEAHDPAPQVLLAASASAGNSAALVGVDLAVAFSEAGRKTALVLSSAETASATAALGLDDDACGLAEVLTGAASFDETLHSTERSNLFVVPSGKSHVEPMLSSPAMSGFLDDLRKNFDRIMIATAPVNASSAASVISAIADATLLVVNERSAGRRNVEKAVSELKAARAYLLGAVLVRS
jgi:succinoglycan biosynthesis transport protein ExoP